MSKIAVTVSDDAVENAIQQKLKAVLTRDTCLAIREEGLRAAAAPGASRNTAESIASMAETMGELDAQILAAKDSEDVLSFASRIRSNCARGIAVAVRGAIDWREISPSLLASLGIVACRDPEGHSFPQGLAT